MKKWQVLTVEHRCYHVVAKTKAVAMQYISNEADLRPKDKSVELVDIGDFEIVEK